MTDNFGNGQMQPWDTTSDFNAISFIIEQALARTRTMTLVKVVAVTNDGGVSPVGFVDVHPMVNMLDGAGVSSPHRTVFHLPYFRLQGGANAVILDPIVGDIGLAVIADRDISAVKSAKADANPGSGRRFDLADGVYIGGILNGAPSQYVRFTDSGILLADKNGNVVEMKSGSIAITGNLTVTGGVTAGFGGVDAVTLQQHVHTANNTPPTPGT